MTAAIELNSAQQFYDLLEPEKRIVVRQKTSEIKSLLRVCWSEVAHRAIEVKAELSHGQFLIWVELEIQPEFGIGERTLRLMMSAVRVLSGKSENFADLPIQKSAAYELAAAPELAQDEAIALAESGETITRAKVKEIIARHQPGDAIEYQGRQFTVESSDDIVVQARHSDGTVTPILTAELLPATLPSAPPAPTPATPKPAPIESLSFQLESAEARLELLEAWMRSALPHVPAALRQQGETLLA